MVGPVPMSSPLSLRRAFRLFVTASLLGSASLFAAELANKSYKIEASEKGSLTITNSAGCSSTFLPRFVVLASATDPKVAMRQLDLPTAKYHAPSWLTTKKASSFGKANTQVEGGDGFDPSVQKGDTQGRTVDIFRVGDPIFIEATKATATGNRIDWEFPENPGFKFTASAELPEGESALRVSYTITPTAGGFYSVGYAGAPAADIAEVDEIWQPLIWQEKRFPKESSLTSAGYCTLPAAFWTKGGCTSGVVVDPVSFPFMPLPSWSNSQFAVGVRNEKGQAQGLIFSPILGGPKSAMTAGAPYEFHIQLYVGKGGCTTAYEDIARSIYGFSDYRENVGVSLNKTIDNMIDYGLSSFSRFDDDLKGCMYETDVPGAVKNVSALHPLEMALLTDNKAIYEARALPILEFLLSREKFLFVLDKNVKTQNPGRLMTGPCAESSEFAAAYAFGGEQSPLLLKYAQDLAKAKVQSKKLDAWVQQLALYHSLEDPELLKQARAGADAYIAKRIDQTATDFDAAEAGAFFFWTSYSPLWINLLDLYEVTKDKRYLDAAHKGAREFTQYVMMSPKIPSGNVTVNIGGKAPQYATLLKKTTGAIATPEETVPAWRLSEIGLTAESSSTIISHRAIFMANFAPWMMRLSELTGDSYLHDVARAAVVGRYQNFPGYHINTERSTVYEKADYPYRSHKDLSYNSFHYNHVWPLITMLTDYLVNDVFAKSNGKIDFPGRYSQGYGYLQSRIYGDRPGVFYDEKDVRLWLPKDLLAIESPQINFLSAHRGDAVFLALANQSPADVTTTMRLNPALVTFPATVKVRVWRNNEPAEGLEMKDGSATVSISANGITGLAIDGVTPKIVFQNEVGKAGKVFSNTAPLVIKTGDARAMILTFAGMNTAYIYLKETDDTLASATLRYRVGEEWKSMTDAKYPYEFSIPLDAAANSFEFTLETTAKDGFIDKSDPTTLTLTPPSEKTP